MSESQGGREPHFGKRRASEKEYGEERMDPQQRKAGSKQMREGRQEEPL